MTSINAILAAAALVAATAAAALDIEGVKLDEQASVAGQPLVLNGAGLRKRAIFKVYVGSLYLPQKASTLQAALAGAPRRIQLNLLRNLSSDQLVGALVEGLKDNLTPAQMQAISRETGELAAAMKAFGEVREGSIVTLDFVDGATRIGLDGTSRASIEGTTFNEALTKIWLGEHPVQADLKRAMLGGA